MSQLAPKTTSFKGVPHKRESEVKDTKDRGRRGIRKGCALGKCVVTKKGDLEITARSSFIPEWPLPLYNPAKNMGIPRKKCT